MVMQVKADVGPFEIAGSVGAVKAAGMLTVLCAQGRRDGAPRRRYGRVHVPPNTRCEPHPDDHRSGLTLFSRAAREPVSRPAMRAFRPLNQSATVNILFIFNAATATPEPPPATQGKRVTLRFRQKAQSSEHALGAYLSLSNTPAAARITTMMI